MRQNAPKGLNVLNDKAVKAAESKDKAYDIADGQSLYLQVHPRGAKAWKFRFKLNGKQYEMILGHYPAMSLAEARKRRDWAKSKLNDGIDPRDARNAEKAEIKQKAQAHLESEYQKKASDKFTLRAGFELWFETQKKGASGQGTLDRIESGITRYVLAKIGSMPMAEVETEHLMPVLEDMLLGKDAVPTMAEIVYTNLKRMWRYCGLKGKVKTAPLDLMKDWFYAQQKTTQKRPEHIPQHQPSVSPQRLPELLQALRAEGDTIPANCLWLSLYTGVRPAEAREAAWDEIDLDAGLWVIHASRMKEHAHDDIGHHVPLCRQAVAMLRKMKEKATSKYVFDTSRGAYSGAPLSKGVIGYLLTKIGFGQYNGKELNSKDRYHTAHGCRSLFANQANLEVKRRPGCGWDMEVIERQLDHLPEELPGIASTAVRRHYVTEQYLESRVKLMNWWGNELERQEALQPAPVVPLRKAA